MKRILSISMFALSACMLMAMPAKRDGVPRVMDDGTVVTVYLHGDESFHYTTLADGTFVRENAEGRMVRTETLTEEQISERFENSKIRRMRQITDKATPLNIAPRGLIILVSYSDVKIKEENTLEEFRQMHNGENYTNNGATGSARQYFIDQSMGKYKPQFDVVGPVTLENTQSYYGKNSTQGDDMHATDMIAEACKLADQQFDVNFAEYDNDNDGEVDFVYVIYAGFGEADGGGDNTVWPHAYWLWKYHGEIAGNIDLQLDGKRINTYACSSELDYTTQGLSGIGTFCHEFSHVLGLPDLYATNNATHATLGSWDILDYGPYNNHGKTPPAYSAYERFFMGWLKPVLLTEDAQVVLDELKECNCAGIITADGTSNLIGNDPNPLEFFMIENRQKTGWDKPLKGHGMMLTKVKYSYTKWYNNTVNNQKANMGVDIIEANGKTSQTGRSTDLYPAGANMVTPYENYPLTNIAESEDGIITFDFMSGGNGKIVNISKLSNGIEDIVASTEQDATVVRKVLLDGEIYIIRDGKTYNTLGQEVR